MLVERGARHFGGGVLGLNVALGDGFLVAVVDNRKLAFDSRFVPPETQQTDNLILLLVLEGRFEVVAPTPQTFHGPCLLVLTENQFEGALGRRTVQFRTGGDVYRSIHVRVSRAEAAVSVAPEVRAIPVDPAVRRRGEEALAETHPDAFERATLRYLEALRDAALVAPALVERATLPSRRSHRIWAALRPHVARLHGMATLDELALDAGLSTRTIAREVARFFATFPFLSDRWGSFILRGRFKLAVQGLSAPDSSVAEVAGACGYGSSEAMARAFRDAGLPSPGQVREALRAAGPT